MKSLLMSTAAIAWIILATSCDPAYQVEYEIRNDSATTIAIQVDPFTGAMDTSTIANGTRLTFFFDSGNGSATERHLKRLKTLPFEIFIVNSSGTAYNKDAQDISNWEKISPDSEYNTIGRVQLRVGPEDFD